MRTTKNRQKILEFMDKNPKAYTAQDIHAQLSDMDLATIYRNLNKFVDQGLVKELRINKGESMYEINKDDHDHAVCNKCGKVMHISIDKELLKKSLKLNQFEIEDIEINIRGKCR